MTGTRKALNLAADPYLRDRAKTNPVIDRFFTIFEQLSEVDKCTIESVVILFMDKCSGMGKLGAIELTIKLLDWQAAQSAGDRRFLRRAHVLELRGWPAPRQTGYIPAEAVE